MPKSTQLIKNQLSLKHAVREYINDTALKHFSTDELYKALDALSEQEWQDINKTINSLQPAPYSYPLGLINDQLPDIEKQSGVFGVFAMLLAYYLTQDFLLSICMGVLITVIANQCLTSAAYEQEVYERSLTMVRINDLQQHNRFFKPHTALRIPHSELALESESNSNTLLKQQKID